MRLTSELHDVPGIGQKTVEKLLRTFGSLERIRQTTGEDLARVVGKAAAARLQNYLNGQIGSPSLVQIAPRAEPATLQPLEEPEREPVG